MFSFMYKILTIFVIFMQIHPQKVQEYGLCQESQHMLLNCFPEIFLCILNGFMFPLVLRMVLVSPYSCQNWIFIITFNSSWAVFFTTNVLLLSWSLKLTFSSDNIFSSQNPANLLPSLFQYFAVGPRHKVCISVPC